MAGGSNGKRGSVLAVCVSAAKGVRKSSVPEGHLKEDFGLEGDAHAGSELRQVSLLCQSSAEKIEARGLKVGPGDFAENLTVAGVDAGDFEVGAQIRFDDGPLLAVTRIGKRCHDECEIKRLVGMCVMPTEGIFTRVIRGGRVRAGDGFEILDPAGCGTSE